MMFKNYQQMGEFGEYVYYLFAKSKKLNPKIMKIQETDIVLSFNKEKFFIDVKTTDKPQKGYKGKKHKKNIIYDQVVIDQKNNLIRINPDNQSPLNKMGDLQILDLKKKFIIWNNKTTRKTLSKSKPNNTRKLIIKEIKKIFSKKNINPRIIIRGIVSKKRWSGKPDNLPGSLSVIKKYPLTIFVQMKYKNETEEEIYKIYLFDHKQLDKNIKLVEGNKRQKLKGYMKVIDINFFEKNNSSFVFRSINQLNLFLDDFSL